MKKNNRLIVLQYPLKRNTGHQNIENFDNKKYLTKIHAANPIYIYHTNYKYLKRKGYGQRHHTKTSESTEYP